MPLPYLNYSGISKLWIEEDIPRYFLTTPVTDPYVKHCLLYIPSYLSSILYRNDLYSKDVKIHRQEKTIDRWIEAHKEVSKKYEELVLQNNKLIELFKELFLVIDLNSEGKEKLLKIITYLMEKS